MQPQEISEHDVNQYKNTFTLKQLSKTFHDIENTKDKISEASPILERSMTVPQSPEKMFPLYFIMQLEESKHVKITLDIYFFYR